MSIENERTANRSEAIFLPVDADVRYYPQFLSSEDAKRTYDAIVGQCDLSDAVIMAAGKAYTLTVGKCMFVDEDLIDTPKIPPAQGDRRGWIPEVSKLRKRVEQITQCEYRACVGVYYRNGERGMDFHSDLPAFGNVRCIASVSLGAERELAFRSVANPEESHTLKLANGSLLIMGEHCQDRYEHALLRDPQCRLPRLNLTFRAVD